MAFKRIKYKDHYEDEVAEFIVDLRSEINSLPTSTTTPNRCAVGSRALCTETAATYVLQANNTWIELDPVVVQSAYEAARRGGYTGTEEEFYADLSVIQDLADELEGLL